MKRIVNSAFAVSFILFGSAFLLAWDNQPSYWKILPEVIWSPATGGGTWVTEIQITNCTDQESAINVFTTHGGSFRGPIELTTLKGWHTYRTPNLLSVINDLDDEVNYYGKVGAVWFAAARGSCRFQVTAYIRNGNYGKTFPGLSVVNGHTCAQGRPMMLQALSNGNNLRSFIGVFNTSHYATYLVGFTVFGEDNTPRGGFSATIAPFEFRAYNVFEEAGLGGDVYTNAWLLVGVVDGGTATRGLMLFGSVANNITNDPSSVIAFPWTEEPAATTPSIREMIFTDPRIH